MEGSSFLLYRYIGSYDPITTEYDIGLYKSTLFAEPLAGRLKCRSTDEYNDFYTEMRWRIASGNKLSIYYICSGGVIAHSSFCTPKSFKFPFMKENDYHIGPCFTDEKFRGKGLYPTVLQYIASDLKRRTDVGNIYMIISAENSSSRNGVKKAGFVETAMLTRKGRLRRYYVDKWL